MNRRIINRGIEILREPDSLLLRHAQSFRSCHQRRHEVLADNLAEHAHLAHPWLVVPPPNGNVVVLDGDVAEASVLKELRDLVAGGDAPPIDIGERSGEESE